MTFSYISRLEAGGAAPGIDLVEGLAQALGVQVADLLPASRETGSTDEARLRMREQFEADLLNAGPETLSVLGVLVARLAEAPGLRR